MKTGIIDTGGGMRGIYADGVLDGCLLRKDCIHFDVGIGISAGSANLSSYIAGQQQRNYRFYMEYSFRRQYMSLSNFIRKKSYIDMDYVYGTLSNSGGENPLDFNALMNNPTGLIVVATNAVTGEAVYFDKNDMAQDDYSILKASSSIPFVCKPYPVRGTLYYDGALSDPIPLDKAFSAGCDKVVLILTKPKDLLRTSGKDTVLAKRIRKKYPMAAEGLRQRAKRYNEGVARAKQLEEQGRVLIVSPDDLCGMNTLTKDKKAMRKMYQKGLRDAAQIQNFLQA